MIKYQTGILGSPLPPFSKAICAHHHMNERRHVMYAAIERMHQHLHHHVDNITSPLCKQFHNMDRSRLFIDSMYGIVLTEHFIAINNYSRRPTRLYPVCRLCSITTI